MSLDVWLIDADGAEVYWANITSNLSAMAREAGIYDCLWWPDESGIVHAKQIVAPLAAGLALLVGDQERFEKLNAPNGWGKWKQFVPWCERYLQACRNNPESLVHVSR